MPLKTSQSCNNDFKEVITFLKEKKIILSPISSQKLSSAKKMHAASYSLILWRFNVGKMPEHSRVFLEEIASDALQVMPQALAGYNKTVTLLIRSIFENAMRHIYFHHHPIEYQRVNNKKKWYISNEELFKYLYEHPIFIDTESQFDAVSRLKSLNDELSANVHGRTVKHLEMHRALKNIKFNQSKFDTLVKLIVRCAEGVNFLFLMFHRDLALKFSNDTKKNILSSIPPKARRIWRGLA